MTNRNRGRLIIDLSGDWKQYSESIPGGAKALGTVARKKDDIGGLVKLEDESYAQINNGVLRPVDGRKVAAALGTIGRPIEMENGRAIQVYLSESLIVKAREAGDGNLSKGIRLAIENLKNQP